MLELIKINADSARDIAMCTAHGFQFLDYQPWNYDTVSLMEMITDIGLESYVLSVLCH